MMTASFDREKCKKRNHIAVLRDGVDALPVQILRATPMALPDLELHYAQGSLPDTKEEALAMIHKLQPEGTEPLTADQVYIHFVEAGNGNLLGDRFMFIDESSLRNFAEDAVKGVAYMNSHATGGPSHPAELPMGRTFAGRFEKYRAIGDEKPVIRTLIGFYMVAGTFPNGRNAPGTDDLHKSISGGSLFDVSMGMQPGYVLCDVCGNKLGTEGCGHAPGTHRDMTKDNVAAQKARGVPEGLASYTLMNAHLGELSGVYNGAVPGAGYRRVVAMSRQGMLSSMDLDQVLKSYAGLARRGDLRMDQLGNAALELRRIVRGAVRAEMNPKITAGQVTELRTAEPANASPEILARLEAAERAAAQANTRVEAAAAQGRREYVLGLIRARILTKGEEQYAVAKLEQAAEADVVMPAGVDYFTPDGKACHGSRVEAAKAELEHRKPHNLDTPTLPGGGTSPLYALSVSAPVGPDEEFNAYRQMGQNYAASTQPPK